MSYQFFIKDKNLVPENIKKGVTILKVTGTLEGSRTVTLQSKTVDSSTEKQTVTYDSSYDGLSSVTVEAYELDAKTVKSSTSQQVITSDKDGLSSVTVNPYTVEERTVTPGNTQIITPLNADAISKVTVNRVSLRSKTINPSTASQTYTAAAEGVNGYGDVTVTAVDASIDSNIQAGNIKKDVTILGVTGTLEEGGGVNNQNKTVSSSTSNQTVTYDSGYTGLGTVTVNKYTLDSKTVDPSTSQQTVNSSADGLSSVTVNAVTSSIDGNIQAGNIKKDVTILGVTGTYESSPVQPVLQDVSVSYTQNGEYTLSASSGYDGLGTVTVDVSVAGSGGSDWVLDVREGNISDLSSHKMDAPTRDYQYNSLFIGCEIDQLPDMSDWTSISGASSCENMFKDASSSNTGSKIADLSSLTTLSGGVYNMFNGSKITELWLPNLTTINAASGLNNIVGPAEASTLKTLKINVVVAQPYGMTGTLTESRYVAGVENIEITGMATTALSFTYMNHLTADSVLNILTHLGTPMFKKNVSFASNGGLVVTDYPDGRIQAAYDAAIATGLWNIYNLTITPFDDEGLFECPDCGGTGEVNGETCETCGGIGYVDWDPNAGETFECPDCGGTGEVNGETCETCGGSGCLDYDPTE